MEIRGRPRRLSLHGDGRDHDVDTTAPKVASRWCPPQGSNWTVRDTRVVGLTADPQLGIADWESPVGRQGKTRRVVGGCSYPLVRAIAAFS